MKKILSWKQKPWIWGVLMGVIVASVYLSITNIEADDSVAHYEIDLSSPLTEQDYDDFQDFVENQADLGKDVVLVPKDPVTVLSSEERRKIDDERAIEEQARIDSLIEDGLESGLYTQSNPDLLPCMTNTIATNGTPSIYLMCGTKLVPAPSQISFERANSLNEAESLLEQYIRELLRGVSTTNEASQYTSLFSDDGVLHTIELDDEGLVTLDFNHKFLAQNGHLHGSYAALMIKQIEHTVFQFRDVSELKITLDGSCDAFAQAFQFVCIHAERETWELTLNLNNEEVPVFNLQGD